MLSALRRASLINTQLNRSARTNMTDAALAQGPQELQNPGLVFLVAQTPNGNKPLYYAEELKAIGAIKDYTFIPINFSRNEQKTEWFEAVNPNGRIPALRDNRVGGKKPINVWESASMLLYLAKEYDVESKFWFKDDEDLHQEMLNWLFFIQGGVGPMQGQANHFFRYAPEKIPYGIERYQNETKRLYSIYEQHLQGDKDGEKKDWLVGGKYTLADMCTQPWLRMARWAGIDLEPFPAVKAWVERIDKREATVAALKIPEQDHMTTMKQDPEAEKRMQEEASKWVMAGNKK
ncbi:hypothetical protein JCM11641_002649 [Rhodosporidiobolus odoratus]